MTTKAPHKDSIKSILQFTMMISPARVYCYWCGQAVKACTDCHGDGAVKGTICKHCKGHGRLCPKHDGDWT